MKWTMETFFLNCRENHSSTTKIELFNFILFYSSGERGEYTQTNGGKHQKKIEPSQDDETRNNNGKLFDFIIHPRIRGQKRSRDWVEYREKKGQKISRERRMSNK